MSFNFQPDYKKYNSYFKKEKISKSIVKSFKFSTKLKIIIYDIKTLKQEKLNIFLLFVPTEWNGDMYNI